jgi:hypothetical protein
LGKKIRQALGACWQHGSGLERNDKIKSINEDGYPMILPAIQATMKDGGRMIIPFSAYPEELGKIKPGAKMAAYLANMDLVTVLLH